jgi:two-component system, OmpR family, response regulator CpxR
MFVIAIQPNRRFDGAATSRASNPLRPASRLTIAAAGHNLELSGGFMLQGGNSRVQLDCAQEAPVRRILLIDDDREMAEMLAEYLLPEGFKVEVALTAKAGMERAAEGGVVLILLDVMLPDCDGFSVLGDIRRASHIPVILLTTRGALEDKVSGLEGGADDYLPKPFNPLELLARIRTVLRRGQPSRFGSAFLCVGDLTVDAGRRSVERGGERIDCTAAEFDVLNALVSAAGEVVTREHLTRLALGRASYAGDRAIDNLVSALRRKLGPGADEHERIRSIRNAGYVYPHPSASEPHEPGR